MSGLLGQRAVVVGAGVGGLSMAGALANCFEQVEILERDRLTASIGSRSGTPQDRHPHALLAGGLRALDEIFPGFADDLAGAGAVSVRVARDKSASRRLCVANGVVTVLKERFLARVGAQFGAARECYQGSVGIGFGAL